MSAYQRFLDFFEMNNKERLDGLNESYFSGMSKDERDRAFQFLLEKAEAGGSEESVNGLFQADAVRAIEPVRSLLAAGRLRPEAEIAAAWNLTRTVDAAFLLPIFIKWMASDDSRVRSNAAYYVPSEPLTAELKAALQGMIRTETVQLARIHAVDKLLMAYGVNKESVGKDVYLGIFRGLHSDEMQMKEAAFKKLDAIVS